MAGSGQAALLRVYRELNVGHDLDSSFGFVEQDTKIDHNNQYVHIVVVAEMD